MKTGQIDQAWEEKIYSQNAHINRYPYGELVPTFFQALKFLKNASSSRQETKVLEIGCGAGNNLWFFCREGFDVYGIDGSDSACAIAAEQLDKHGFSPTLKRADFGDLPFEDQSFDIIVDRESTYCGTLEEIKTNWQEANRVLKPGGMVISFIYRDDHPDCVRANRDENFATKIEKNSFTGFQSGSFKDTGIAHFSTREDLDEIFDFLDIKFINKHSTETMYDSCDHRYHYSEWIVVGVKK